MLVTDAHVAVLRAMLMADDDEYERRVAEVMRSGHHEGFLGLLGCTFQDAVVRRFSRDSTWRPTEVARFVAAMRSQWADDGVRIDPNIAERLIRVELGHGERLSLNDREVVHALITTLMELIHDERLDDDGLYDVIARARVCAEARPSQLVGPTEEEPDTP